MTARKNLSILVRNDDTGEIFETDERFSIHGGFTTYEPSTEKQKEHQTNLRNQKSLSKELGGFVKVLYYNNEVLFDEQLGLSKSTITRLMMLSTYLDFNNVLVKELPKRRQTADKTCEPMDRKDIQSALILEKKAFASFMKEVEACGILIKCDDCYKLSSEFFYKGETSRDVCFTKMYVETVRELYRGVALTSSIRAHSTLSFVFQLMPFVHWETNFVVQDRLCATKDMVPLSLEEMCIMLKLDITKCNMKSLEKRLLKFKVKFRGSTYHLFNMITFKGEEETKSYFAVNPLIYNSMSDFNGFKKTLKEMWVE